MTDEQLLKLFQSGNAEACDELLLRYKDKVLSIARKYIIAGGDREDLVQEGMCGLYSAMMTFKGDGVFAPYAYTCIKNRILDYVKSVVRKTPSLGSSVVADGEDEMADNSPFTPEDILILTESEGEFDVFMKKVLSSFEYIAFKMYMEGASLAEIASALNKTYKQTDNAIARAKQKLRSSYGK